MKVSEKLYYEGRLLQHLCAVKTFGKGEHCAQDANCKPSGKGAKCAGTVL